MQMAVEDLFRAKWSADIHQGWIEALLKHEPHRDRITLERTRTLMDTAVRDALVTDDVVPHVGFLSNGGWATSHKQNAPWLGLCFHLRGLLMSHIFSTDLATSRKLSAYFMVS